MVEIELKFIIKGNSAKHIRTLRALGFLMAAERSYEETTMYDNPQGLMQTSNGRVRVRIIRRKGFENCEFSHKLPLPIDKSGIKKEIEYEVTVSDGKELGKLLKAMEFEPTTSYERYRTCFKNDNIKVTFDEYPYATFIEIEGKQSAILPLAKKLGFNLKENLSKPCDTLFTEWRKSRGLPMNPHMRFRDYDK